MLKPDYTNQFKKELDLMLRRGKDKQKIAAVIVRLVNQAPLEPKHRDHVFSWKFQRP